MAFQLWEDFLQRVLIDFTVEKVNMVTVMSICQASRQVMQSQVNYVCHLDWAMRCPDI